MSDYQLGKRVALDKMRQMVCYVRQASAAMDEHRHSSLRRQRHDRLESRVVDVKPLRAGMELDPACPQVEAALRLLERRFVEIEAHEGDQPALRSLGVGKRAIVRLAKGRVPIWLVEREDEAALDSVTLAHCHQLVVCAGHTVDVGPEMNVRVENGGFGRKLIAKPRLPGVDQHLGADESFVHIEESIRACDDSETTREKLVNRAGARNARRPRKDRSARDEGRARR